MNCALMPALTGQKVLNRFPGVVWSGDAVAGDKTADETAVRPDPAIAMNKVPEVAIGFWIIKIPPPPWGRRAAMPCRCR